MSQLQTLILLPQLVQYSTIVTLNYVIATGGVPFCDAIMITEDSVTSGIGFKLLNTTIEQCAVEIIHFANMTDYLTFSPGSYRTFKEMYLITCEDHGNGFYTNCDDTNFNLIIPTQMSHDFGKEVEVVSSSGIAGSSLEWNKPFENLSKSNIALIVIWVIIGLLILAVIIVGIIFFKCFCNWLNTLCPS
jgi:hypothetical protein